MKRVHQVILIVSMLVISWLGMMVAHELGHVIGAWTSGGTVSRVVLHPLQFSRTEVSNNPHPLWEVSAGPTFGVLLPLLAWLIAAWIKSSFTYLLRFFAGFCFVANGAYLGVGAFDHIADAGDLLALGASSWQLWLFGVICVPLGFALWHGLGPKFGLGGANGKVNIIHTYVLFGLLIVLVALESVFVFI